jgi:myo-inositol 2-dehydrogenase / D-chiro-inositol 1-dehydrogenase
MGFEHIRNFALQDEVELAAIADPNSASLDIGRQAAKAPIDLFESAEAMLAATELDLVFIATPNFTHAQILDELLDAPVHLVVEKPLCTTLEDCQHIVDRTRDRQGLFWVGMEYRYMPPVARLLAELHAGRAGNLRMSSIREHRFPFLEKVGDWNRFNRNTGGTLVEECCDFFDLMRLIVGRPAKRVFASGAQDVNHLDEVVDGEKPDILDNAFVVVDFEGGIRAMLDLCMFAEASRNEQEICATGDRGKIECFIPESVVVIGERRDRQIERISIPVDAEILAAGFHHGATYFQHRAILEAIRDPAAPRIDAEAGRDAVSIGIAAQESITSGAPVELDSHVV